MNTLKIEIHTNDWPSIDELLEKHNLSQKGNEIQISDQATLRYEGARGIRGYEIQEVYDFCLTFLTPFLLGIAAELTANLLYDLLKGEREKEKSGITRLFIEETTVKIDELEIKRIIKEKLEIK